MKKLKILFVCLGNICRSPMAEGIMKELVKKHKLDWYIDSAGTEFFHIGEMPDPRAIRTCETFGIDITNQRARRINKKDFEQFDIIYAVATDVLNELLEMKPAHAHAAELKLLLDELHPGEHRSVHDPWYEKHDSAFVNVFRVMEEACVAIVMKANVHP